MEERDLIYVAGRIDNNDPELLGFYERVTKLLESLDFKVWLPHRDARKLIKEKYRSFEDRALALYIEAEKVIKERVKLILAYVGRPSLGTGQELQIGREIGIDIVGLAKEDDVVTPTVLGNPSLRLLIRFRDMNDLLGKLKNYFSKYKEDPDYFKKNYDSHQKFLVWSSPEEQRNQYKWMWEDLV